MQVWYVKCINLILWFWPCEIALSPKPINMNKILLGALVAAAVAGVVWYLYDEESFLDTVDDIRDKADEAMGKVRGRFGQGDETPEMM